MHTGHELLFDDDDASTLRWEMVLLLLAALCLLAWAIYMLALCVYLEVHKCVHAAILEDDEYRSWMRTCLRNWRPRMAFCGFCRCLRMVCTGKNPCIACCVSLKQPQAEHAEHDQTIQARSGTKPSVPLLGRSVPRSDSQLCCAGGTASGGQRQQLQLSGRGQYSSRGMELREYLKNEPSYTQSTARRCGPTDRPTESAREGLASASAVAVHLNVEGQTSQHQSADRMIKQSQSSEGVVPTDTEAGAAPSHGSLLTPTSRRSWQPSWQRSGQQRALSGRQSSRRIGSPLSSRPSSRRLRSPLDGATGVAPSAGWFGANAYGGAYGDVQRARWWKQNSVFVGQTAPSEGEGRV